MREKLRIRNLAAAAAVAALAGGGLTALEGADAVHAQGITIGGTVSSFIGLSLTQPTGLTTFPSANGTHVYTTTINAAVTTTDPVSQLTVVDGGAFTGTSHGHLVSGKTGLGQPLQAATAGSFQSLAAPVDPLLTQWTGALGRQITPIHLEQRIVGKLSHRGPYGKLVLVTVSDQTP
jgi:hypothetical protein